MRDVMGCAGLRVSRAGVRRGRAFNQLGVWEYD